MPDSPSSWPRPHFTPGGGDALLSYAVFGDFDLAKPLSRSKYRVPGVPDWLELRQYDRATQADVFAHYLSGPVWDILTRDSPLTAAAAGAAPQCVGLRGEVPDPPTLDYFRDAIGVVAWLLDAGGLVVHDPQMLWLWSADEWRDEAFGPGDTGPDRHTTILVSAGDDGATWFHTRGMRKFGRPDLSVRGVGPGHTDAVTELVERFVAFQALGGVIAEGADIRIPALPSGGVCRHRGTFDDPDFNNVHVEIEWPAGRLG